MVPKSSFTGVPHLYRSIVLTGGELPAVGRKGDSPYGARGRVDLRGRPRLEDAENVYRAVIDADGQPAAVLFERDRLYCSRPILRIADLPSAAEMCDTYKAIVAACAS